MALRLEPVRLALGDDGDGRLVFVDDVLVAILVRLSDQHERRSGAWFLEVGFGQLDGTTNPVFVDLDTAHSWIAARLARTAPGLAPPFRDADPEPPQPRLDRC